MTDNARKTPEQFSLQDIGKRRAYSQMMATGWALPCSVVAVISSNIVTVKFEVNSSFTIPQVTVSTPFPEYIRIPYQKGDVGVCAAADAQLASIIGLAPGVADLSLPGNMQASLYFAPLSKTGLFSVDPNALVLYGPNGVVLTDSQQKVSYVQTPSGITINAGGQPVMIIGASRIDLNP